MLVFVYLQAMIYASRCVDSQESLNGAQYDEDSAVFFLELLIKVVLQNRSVVFFAAAIPLCISAEETMRAWRGGNFELINWAECEWKFISNEVVRHLWTVHKNNQNFDMSDNRQFKADRRKIHKQKFFYSVAILSACRCDWECGHVVCVEKLFVS